MSLSQNTIGQWQKDLYGRNVRGNPFEEGDLDLVWLYNPTTGRSAFKKLACFWTGQYMVVKKLSDAMYRIQYSQNKEQHVIHFDHLKLCVTELRVSRP